MPLRFGPGSGRSSSATPLAVVYTLRHEDPVILKTYRSKRMECAPDMRRKPPRTVYIFLPSSSQTTQETKEEEQHQQQQQKESNSTSNKITPLKQQDLFYSRCGEGSAYTYTIPKPVEVEPIDLPVFSVPLRRPLPFSPQLLPLLDHNEVPFPLTLTLSRTLPQRRMQSKARRAELMRRALEGSRVSLTWEEMLEVSRVAWNSAVQIPVTITPPPPPLLLLPNLPLFSPHFCLPPQMMEQYDASSPSCSRDNNNNTKKEENMVCYLFDSIVVPRWKPNHQLKKRGMLRWCPIPPDRNTLIDWNLSWQALLNQETLLESHFHEATKSISEITRPSFPDTTLIVDELPFIREKKNVNETFELIHIVVPCISRVQMQKETRRQQCYANIHSTLVQNLSSNIMPKRMKRAIELRFPEGKHVRQTLTLRNVAAERLQEDIAAIRIRRHQRQRQRKGVVHWIREGSTPVLQRRDLWTVVLLSSRALSAAHQFEPPKSSEILWNKSKRECQLQPPSLILSPFMLDGAVLFSSYGCSSCLPLAVEEVDDGSCCRREDAVLCPLRVFSREEELQSFRIMREREMRWEVKKEIDMGNEECNGKEEEEEEEEEKWYHAAFLDDIRSMALPYRNSVALIEDAKLHYYCRLALHQEKKRLGLHETR
ncbi:uncharacterized protein TM35_000371040 [Trypanosoma theileri]|uniref:Uncharacterized protein n=1 Tax=Trypanosoma theileri TaxID=67003 RepID=A0A1X0NKN1_9TRYP|nr:uncharacterized protein TM35_000371040 [Trypanosoma theileri]ORC85131.1 hypothetical protein TM35_000371040 [Trypanosoma theileri]